MYKATLYFSDSDKDTREAALARVIELGEDVGFEVGTINKTIGIWNGAREPGFTYMVLHPVRTILEPKAEQIAARLALEYIQASVAVELEQILSARLVSPDGTSESI